MTNKIQRYNQFLIHLDEQQHSKKKENKVGQDKEKKQEEFTIEELLKLIGIDFYDHHYDSLHFSGYQKEEETKKIDPNAYVEPNADLDLDLENLISNSFPSSSILLSNQSFLTKSPSILDATRKIKEKRKEGLQIQIPDKIQERKKEKVQDKKQNEAKKKKDILLEKDKEIQTLDDLLSLIQNNPLEENTEYNINLKALHNIREPLEQLNAIVGMNSLKNNIVDQILYFIQEFYKKDGDTKTTTTNAEIMNQDFLHTVISGPPGTGKTEVAKLMGNMYSKLGILNKGTFKKVTRSDLIAGYLGQTAIKTKDVIRESLGGVLFIDEAYSLGNQEKRDSFSKECIDTLCEALSDYKDQWMVILAGYEEELRDCFFSYNQGLESRFTWRFQTEKYTGEELYLIFLKKVKDIGWCLLQDTTNPSGKMPTIKEKITGQWFEKNKDHFPYYGRDMETLLARTKMAHSKRVFGKNVEEKKKISYEDLEKGLAMFLKCQDGKKREEEKERKKIWNSMYV